MKFELGSAAVELQRRRPVVVHDAQHARIACVSGCAWITQEGDPNDVVLRAGESLHVEAAGAVVLQGLPRARLALRPDGARGPGAEDIVLRDGTPVQIRPIRRDDLELERAFVLGLSRESAYQRLLSPRRLGEAELRRLVETDYPRELALIATTRVDGALRQIGVARYAAEPDGSGHDCALVVADAWQRHGLGERLLRRLLDAAAGAGVRAMGGHVLSTNRAMLALARKLGFGLRREIGDATVTRMSLALPY